MVLASVLLGLGFFGYQMYFSQLARLQAAEGKGGGIGAIGGAIFLLVKTPLAFATEMTWRLLGGARGVSPDTSLDLIEPGELREAIEAAESHNHSSSDHEHALREAGAPAHGKRVRHLALPEQLFRSDVQGVPGLMGSYASVADFNARAPRCRRVSRPELETGHVVLFANETLTACYSLTVLQERLEHFLLSGGCNHPVLCRFACLGTFINETAWELPCMCSYVVSSVSDPADVRTFVNPTLSDAEAAERVVANERVAYIRDMRETSSKRLLRLPQRLTGLTVDGEPVDILVTQAADVHSLVHMLQIMRGQFVY